MSQTITQTKELTRYRVTLDVMIDGSNGYPPKDWNWYNLLRLEQREQINDIHVEDLGGYDV